MQSSFEKQMVRSIFDIQGSGHHIHMVILRLKHISNGIVSIKMYFGSIYKCKMSDSERTVEGQADNVRGSDRMRERRKKLQAKWSAHTK